VQHRVGAHQLGERDSQGSSATYECSDEIPGRTNPTLDSSCRLSCERGSRSFKASTSSDAAADAKECHGCGPTEVVAKQAPLSSRLVSRAASLGDQEQNISPAHFRHNQWKGSGC